MNMVSDENRPLVVKQLIDLIKENGYKLDTGFLSVPYLMDVLCQEGQADIAYRLLYQTECPSWLYEVENGATTIWESWSAIEPDGTVGHMSFNHYAFGCVGDWLYRHIGGIKWEQPGYKKSTIEPDTNCGLKWAKAELKTGYGMLTTSWSKIDYLVKLNIEVPANTTATVVLPKKVNVMLNGKLLEDANEGKVKVKVGSGIHQFEYADACVLKG